MPPIAAGTPIDPGGKFVALVLGDSEDRWKEAFAARGLTYHPTQLRLFRHVRAVQALGLERLQRLPSGSVRYRVGTVALV
jgi:predicted metalloprotease